MLSKSMDAKSGLDSFLDFVCFNASTIFIFTNEEKNCIAKDVVILNHGVPPSCTEDYKGI